MPTVNNEDQYFARRVLEMLLIPFNKQSAYKLGLIDESGDIKKDPSNKEEKAALSPLHVVVFKVKQLLENLPSGNSRLKQLAVALQTIRRKPVPAQYLTGISEEYALEFIKSLVFVVENDLCLIDEETLVEDYVESLFEEGEGAAPATSPAPANTTAGIEPKGAPVIKPGTKIKTIKRKALEESSMDTLYVSRPVLNHQEISDWAKTQGFNTTLSDDMHVTICYSRNPVEDLEPKTEELTLGNSTPEFRKVEPLGDGGAIVLHIESPELRDRWKEFRDAGASWDYDGYNPHITISYDGKDLDLSKVDPYLGKIIFGAEKYEALDEDWKDGVEEK